MDDPDQTAPAPRDDGSDRPKPPTERELRDMVTGNERAAPPAKVDKTDAAAGKAIDVEDLNAANDK